MYKSFFVMLGLACVVPIEYLIRHAKHKEKYHRSKSTKVWLCILSIILVGLFVTAFVLMSKSEYPSTVNLVGYGIVTDVIWIVHFLQRRKDREQ